MEQRKTLFQNSRGQKLSGVFHIPDGKGPFPIVIYLHGYGSDKNRNKMNGIIEQLPSVAAFRYDAMGHGESEGDFAETTVSQWVADLNSAIEFVKQQPFVDKTRMALYGSSLGSMAVLLAASGRTDITTITPICPVSDFKNTYTRRLMTGKERLEWKRRGYKEEFLDKQGRMARINYSFYEDGISHNVYAASASITCPGLVIHGTADPVVPFEQSVELVKQNHLLHLHPVEGANHRFTEDAHYQELVAAAAAFLKDTLLKEKLY
ncbi:alpha/beta fold hydrolase [Candidatus Woesearchaeota archaeon]|nr:alpha/beta fold hydrolase [Candidatus Woesearchaeota archaeon]